jgi:AcrR family transcriptional regulator
MKTISGVESWNAVWMPIAALLAPGPAGDEADARAAAQLALRLGHVARAALVAAGDEADPLAVLVEAVERGEEAFAGHAEGGVDALGDQRLDQGVAGGTGAGGGCSHGEDGAGATRVCLDGARHARALRVRPDSSNSPFGELFRMPARTAEVVEIRSRDADRTQQEILAAATAEFAAHGFGGARIDAIAERAGVNKKLIYYYFEGKDELFLAVLEQTYADIRAAERELHLESLAPLSAIESLVAFTWRHYLAHPEFLALLNSENMQGAGHLKRSPRIRQMNSPLIDDLARCSRAARRAASCAAASMRCSSTSRSPASPTSTSRTSTPSARSSAAT